MGELTLEVGRLLGKHWKRLFAVAAVYRVLSLVVLTPLVSLFLQLFLAISSESLLADQDILFFMATPPGLAALVVVGGMVLALFGLELAALMSVLADSEKRARSVLSALGFAWQKSLGMLRVGGRIVVHVTCWLVPFLLALGLIWWTLLSEFDINYYLNEKPPVFWVAVSLGGLLAVVLVVVLVGKLLSWLYVIPITIFERQGPSKVLGESVKRTAGHRGWLLLTLLAWLMATSLLATGVTFLVGWVAGRLLPAETTSLGRLAFAMGAVLLLSGILNLAISLLSTSSLASLIFSWYRRRGRLADGEAEAVSVPVENQSEMIPSTDRGIRATTVIIGGVLACGLALAIGIWVLRGEPAPDEVEIIAHRGASAKAPENTLASIHQAIADGADWVEIDVQEIADGTVVVFHDSDFMKAARNPTKIWNVTPEELKRIDVGSWFDVRFQAERVPTLEQVLDTCRDRVGLFIELKYYGHDQALEQKVVELVESRNMSGQVVIISLKAQGLKKIRSLRPDWQTGQLLSVHVGNLARIPADLLAINAEFASRSLIRSVRQANKQVMVWTVNDPVRMAVMIERGVAGLITDRPELARDVLRQRAAMSRFERLLLELAVGLGLRAPARGTESSP